MAGAYSSHGHQAGSVECRDDQMLRRMGRGPVAWQPEDEDHRGERCIGEPEATPYPERKDGAGGGNQKFCSVRRRRIKATTEQSGLHSRAEKANREGGEGFLDPVAIEPGPRNSEFGARTGE